MAWSALRGSAGAGRLRRAPAAGIQARVLDGAHDLCEELGDVLSQAVFPSRIAAERTAEDGGFTIDEMADTLAAKLIRRHRHVFGSVAVSSADEESARS